MYRYYNYFKQVLKKQKEKKNHLNKPSVLILVIMKIYEDYTLFSTPTCSSFSFKSQPIWFNLSIHGSLCTHSLLKMIENWFTSSTNCIY